MKGLGDSFELVAAFFHAADYLEAERIHLETPAHGFLSRLFRVRLIIYRVHDYHHKPTNFYSSWRALRRSVIPKEVMKEILS